MEKYCIGIDVDKKTFKICLIYRDNTLQKKVKASRTFPNTKEGFVQFSDWLKKHIKHKGIASGYVMEATGVYHEQLAYYLHGQGKTIHIVLPLKSKRYFQSLGLRSKTDQMDARGLAMMGGEQTLDLWQPPSDQLLKLRSVTRQIEALNKSKTSFLNQLEAAQHAAVADPIVIRTLDTLIGQFNKQIARLKKQVEKTIKNDPLLKAKYELVKPLKGVGLMTFAVVIAETDGFALFKNQRQLVSYTGYDVVENQSGQRTGKTRISKKGNAHIRRILHMAALTAVNSNVAVLKNIQARVYQRTGIKMKGTVFKSKLFDCIFLRFLLIHIYHNF